MDASVLCTKYSKTENKQSLWGGTVCSVQTKLFILKPFIEYHQCWKPDAGIMTSPSKGALFNMVAQRAGGNSLSEP